MASIIRSQEGTQLVQKYVATKKTCGTNHLDPYLCTFTELQNNGESLGFTSHMIRHGLMVAFYALGRKF